MSFASACSRLRLQILPYTHTILHFVAGCMALVCPMPDLPLIMVVQLSLELYLVVIHVTCPSFYTTIPSVVSWSMKKPWWVHVFNFALCALALRYHPQFMSTFYLFSAFHGAVRVYTYLRDVTYERISVVSPTSARHVVISYSEQHTMWKAWAWKPLYLVPDDIILSYTPRLECILDTMPYHNIDERDILLGMYNHTRATHRNETSGMIRWEHTVWSKTHVASISTVPSMWPCPNFVVYEIHGALHSAIERDTCLPADVVDMVLVYAIHTSISHAQTLARRRTENQRRAKGRRAADHDPIPSQPRCHRDLAHRPHGAPISAP